MLISLDGPENVQNRHRKFANSQTGSFELLMSNAKRMKKRYFPAACKNVFGVRTDIGNKLKNGEYGFQMQDNIQIENSLAAHCDIKEFGEDVNISNGNSCASPIIAGQIVRILRANPHADYESIVSELQNHAKSESCRGKIIRKHYNVRPDFITTPIIGTFYPDEISAEFIKKKTFISRLLYNCIV